MVGGRTLVEPQMAVAACKDCCALTAVAGQSKAQFRVEVDRCLKIGDFKDKLEESEWRVCRM